MGCDIHPYAEYKKDGVWHPADGWVLDDRYGEGERWRVQYHQGVPRDRDYNWFSWLADVRSGTWGDPTPVLSPPRGVPDDMSERVKGEYEYDLGDGHSHSFFTLAELEEGWKRDRHVEVWFNAAFGNTDDPEVAAWLSVPEQFRGKPPCGYAASGWGPNGEHPRHRWKEKMESIIGPSYWQVWRYLSNIDMEFNVRQEDVRMVFWFDN